MDNYQKTKDDYDIGVKWHFQKSNSYNWSKQLEKFVNLLKGKKVLDAGCGTGRDIKLFLKNNIEVEGIDYSEESIKKCCSLYPNTSFYVGDFRKIDVPNNFYDGIWSCTSILNTPKNEIPNLLNEFSRILKPSGIMFISVKQGIGEKVIADDYGERLFSFFSEDELKQYITSAGFKVLYSEIITDESLTGIPSIKPNLICIYSEKN